MGTDSDYIDIPTYTIGGYNITGTDTAGNAFTYTVPQGYVTTSNITYTIDEGYIDTLNDIARRVTATHPYPSRHSKEEETLEPEDIDVLYGDFKVNE